MNSLIKFKKIMEIDRIMQDDFYQQTFNFKI